MLTQDFNDKLQLLLFSLCCIFLICPTMSNLLQLQKEIKNWMHDVDTRQIIQAWIRSNLKFLYTVSIILGSSFSGIAFCNSNLFQWYICYMNLPKTYQQRFRHKRFFSIVLLENIPQLLLQAIYSIFIFEKLTITTLFAMIFSLISIILTLFEFFMQGYLIEKESMLSIKFTVESDHLQNLSHKQFKQKIEFKRYCISNALAKILSIGSSSVELLKPIASKEGVLLIFHVKDNSVNMQNSIEMINQEIANGRLNTVNQYL